MPRPYKCRKIAYMPGVTFFKPSGIPMRALEEARLSVEEAEAFRLKDLEGLNQEPAATRMNISRPAFQRMLSSTRGKIADALVNGKALRIEDGSYEPAPRSYRCRNGHEWDVPFKALLKEQPMLRAIRTTAAIMSPRPLGGEQRGGERPGKFRHGGPG